MNNILVRTLSGSVFISLVLVPLFIDNPIYAIIILFAFMTLGVIEYGKLFSNSNQTSINWQLNLLFSIAISGIILASFLLNISYGWTFIFPLIFLWSITELWRKKKNPLLNIGVSIFGFFYICIPLLLAIDLHINDTNSFPLLVGMFILIWTNDTFAFLSGKFFGKTKLFERISPKKTWEGSIGGFIFTIIMAVALSILFDKENQSFWIISAAFIAPTAIFGDLLESLFKRSLNVKDSGNIMPGHGGILDRFDATLFTVPFFYIWCTIYFI